MTVRNQGAGGQDKPGQKSPGTADSKSRVRRALRLVLGMLLLSVLLVMLGVYTTTRTESLRVTGFVSGVILTLGSFLGMLGLQLKGNQRQLLSAAIFFLSVGVITSFLCLLIDGVSIALNMDMRPLRAGRCQYYSSGHSFIYESSDTPVSCSTLQEFCSMSVRSGTCYCCDLYNCANGGYLNNYYEYVGVRSCEEVFVLYVCIWTLTGLNLGAFFFGILTTAVLGSAKSLGAFAFADTLSVEMDATTQSVTESSSRPCPCPPSARLHCFPPTLNVLTTKPDLQLTFCTPWPGNQSLTGWTLSHSMQLNSNGPTIDVYG